VPDLIVLGFKDTVTADEAITEMEQLQREGLLSVADWARVIRDENGKTDIRQGANTTAAGAVGGTFLGLLFGLIFLMPLAGAAIGALTGAIAGKFADVGIDDKFIKAMGNQLQPGTSALFVYVIKATTDKVIARMEQFHPEVLRTSLSEDADERLRAAIQVKPETSSTPEPSSTTV
jgi:uncharacterized membrane protein